jgi:sugar phosphate isomerase/epimerase
MRLGAYTAILHDRSIDDTLAVLKDLGLESAEINSGGFLPAPHLPVADIRASRDAREEYLGKFAAAGITLTALNCNGNPLHPDPEVGARHGQDVRDAIELAALLGVKRVVTMSGLPAAEPGGHLPSWSVLAWESSTLDAMDYQWDEVAVPYWTDIQARARDADVKVCIEMHPHNVVYNPATMLRLAERIGATHVGAEMDPSHLFWQGIDPVAAIGALGDLVYNAAAKDTRINEASRINGVLDNRHGRVRPDEPGAVSLGGRYTLSRWPENSSWDFVAVGRGHDVAYWAQFLQALEKVDPEMAVNIEHEDAELDQVEGLRYAARTLRQAAGRA